MVIDRKTGQIGNSTWFPPLVVWLKKLGLDIKLYSLFDYDQLVTGGDVFLKKNWDPDRYEREKDTGALKNLDFVRKETSKMMLGNLWVKEKLEVDILSKKLENNKTLAIGKTIYEWLDGNYNNGTGTAHYVVLIKEFDVNQWLVHDPGLPPKDWRIVPKYINNDSVFSDIMIIGS
ncbi:MAG TPA: hypothetical protein VLE44_02720 [Candidatus Saccharimonadales bacterium]|nr:hypothetical protein [Candidatus Saccharimonadales bacterium]